MKNLIVNLISRQTIPNIEFIRSLNVENAFYLFLTTVQMEKEKRSEAIINLCTGRIKDNFKLLLVSDSDISEILSKLQVLDMNTFNEIFVNITGGTKIMSLAAFEFFNKFSKSKFYYSDVANTKTFENISDANDNIVKKDFLTVKEYLQAYGNKNIFIDDKLYLKELADKLFHITNKDLQTASDFIRFVHNEIQNKTLILEGSKNQKRSKKFNTTVNQHFFDKFNKNYSTNIDVKKLDKVLSDNEFILKTKNVLSQEERKYFNGCWFEEYTYYALADFLKEIGGNLIKGAIINRNAEDKAENELDICFTYKNRLYTIENKFTLGEKDFMRNGNFTKYIYKLQAIKNKFGLTPKAYIATLDSKSDVEKSLMALKRLKDFGLNILTREYFEDTDLLIDFFKKELKINEGNYEQS